MTQSSAFKYKENISRSENRLFIVITVITHNPLTIKKGILLIVNAVRE